MRRPQFTLKTMLWVMLVVAAFFAGIAAQHAIDWLNRPEFCEPIWPLS